MNDQLLEIMTAYSGNCDISLHFWQIMRDKSWRINLKHETNDFKFEMKAEGLTPEAAVAALYSDWHKSQKLSLAKLAPVMQLEHN